MFLSKRHYFVPIYQEAIRIKQLERIHQGEQFAVMSPYKWSKGITHQKNKQKYDEFLKDISSYKYEPSYGRWYEENAAQKNRPPPKKPKSTGIKELDEAIKPTEKTTEEEKEIGAWTIEKSMLIRGIPFDKANQLASKYKQTAFIHKNLDGPVTYYDLEKNTARPTEKIQFLPDLPEKKPEPDSDRPDYRKHDLTKPKKGLPTDPPRTVFRNVNLMYDFDFNKQPFHLNEGPITWGKIQKKLEEYSKTLETQKEKSRSKYQERSNAEV